MSDATEETKLRAPQTFVSSLDVRSLNISSEFHFDRVAFFLLHCSSFCYLLFFRFIANLLRIRRPLFCLPHFLACSSVCDFRICFRSLFCPNPYVAAMRSFSITFDFAILQEFPLNYASSSHIAWQFFAGDVAVSGGILNADIAVAVPISRMWDFVVNVPNFQRLTSVGSICKLHWFTLRMFPKPKACWWLLRVISNPSLSSKNKARGVIFMHRLPISCRYPEIFGPTYETFAGPQLVYYVET